MEMKAKRISALLCVTILLFLSGCGFALGRNVTPDADPDDLWVSTDPDISFVGFDEEKGGPVGQLVHDGEVIDVIMCWGPGAIFDIRRYPMEGPEGILVRGTCNFSQDKGTVQVAEDKGNVLNGVKTLTFVREERDTEGDAAVPCPRT